MKIKLCGTIMLVTLSVFGAVAAHEVSRDGVVIAVPDGEWKQWSGTCTGDWGWQRTGITFSVGTRKYLKEGDYLSSGDIYSIHRFSDLQPEVVAMLKPKGHLTRADTKKCEDGIDVLILEFDVQPTKDAPSITRALYAFREVPEHKAAVEIRCAFTETQAALGSQIFGEALKSLCKKNEPNQLKEPATGAGL